MTITDLKRSITGIVLSHMKKYDKREFTILHGEELYKNVKDDLDKMSGSWWKDHFPMLKYTISVQVHTGQQPGMIVNWHHNSSLDDNWERLNFIFNPVRLAGNHDPIEAYHRAMAII